VALARANLARARALEPAGRVSKQELQQAEMALASAEAMRSAARSQVGGLATRSARPASPRRWMEWYPRGGSIPGALVGPGGNTAPIVTVDRIDVLRLFVSVNEGDVHLLKLGQTAHVDLDALPTTRYEGRVVRLALPSIPPPAPWTPRSSSRTKGGSCVRGCTGARRS